MTGETDGEALRAYLSRLMDRVVKDDDLITLRSVQRAALTSWARKNAINIRSTVLSSREPFTLRALRDGSDAGGDRIERRPVQSIPDASSRTSTAAAVLGIGIDIEDIDGLPRPDDYRLDSFFRDHFSDGEIAYCLSQNDVAASFCGTWAAKEAILKAGFPVERLLDIVIVRDADGRPQYPGCRLSISHTRHAAVAVCLRVSIPTSDLEYVSRGSMANTKITPSSMGRRLAIAATTAAAIVMAVVTTLIMHRS